MIPTYIQAIPGTYSGPAPTTFRQLLGIVAANTTYQWNDSGDVAIYTGDTAPTDTTGVWFKDEANGNAVGVFMYYSGKWRPIPPGADVSALKYFSGDWTQYFDSTGLGLINTRWDGYALANGNNGTPNLQNTFIAVGSYYQAGTGWVTQVENAGTFLNSGGQSTTSLTVEMLPALTWQILVEQQFSGIHGSGGEYVLSTDQGPSDNEDAQQMQSLTMFDPKTVGGFKPIYTLPPYIALGVAMWVGYS